MFAKHAALPKPALLTFRGRRKRVFSDLAIGDSLALSLARANLLRRRRRVTHDRASGR